jgi:hypothetical protein
MRSKIEAVEAASIFYFLQAGRRRDVSQRLSG